MTTPSASYATSSPLTVARARAAGQQHQYSHKPTKHRSLLYVVVGSRGGTAYCRVIPAVKLTAMGGETCLWYIAVETRGTARSASMRGRAAFGTRRSMLMNKRAVALLAILALIPLPACQTLPTQGNHRPAQVASDRHREGRNQPGVPGRARHYSLATSARFRPAIRSTGRRDPARSRDQGSAAVVSRRPRAYGCARSQRHFRREMQRCSDRCAGWARSSQGTRSRLSCAKTALIRGQCNKMGASSCLSSFSAMSRATRQKRS